jgi:hypothetical protein
LLEFGREELGHLSGVLSHCIRCIVLGSLRGFDLVEGVFDLSGVLVAFVALQPFVSLSSLWRGSLCGVVAFVECGSLCGFGAGCGALVSWWPCRRCGVL